jgi:hypothetical protein
LLIDIVKRSRNKNIFCHEPRKNTCFFCPYKNACPGNSQPILLAIIKNKIFTMAANVPLTIQCCLYNNYGNVVSIGTNNLQLGYGTPNLYWAIVVDRTNLNVVQNFTFSDNSDVPAQLVPYQNNSQYILILSTMQLSSINLPVGNFYQFLVNQGAGAGLQKIEQIYAALNCGTWGNLGYTLVTVMDTTAGIDYSAYNQDAFISTLQLMPVQVGTGVLYTPVEF